MFCAVLQVYFNANRHVIEELVKQAEDEGHAGEMEIDDFYFASGVLGQPLSDAEAADHFERVCALHGEETLSFNQFLGWMARRNGIEDDLDEGEEEQSEQVLSIENGKVLGALLEAHGSGDFGDVHLQDLSSVMSSKNRNVAALAAREGGCAVTAVKKASRMGGLQGIVRKAMEKLKMVKDAGADTRSAIVVATFALCYRNELC